MNQDNTKINEDALQKAINDITNRTADGGAVGVAAPVAAPAGSVTGGDGGVLDGGEGSGGKVEGGSVGEPAASDDLKGPDNRGASGDEGDLVGVKNAILGDLKPLLSRVEMPAEEKFGIYRDILDGGDVERGVVEEAYEAARGIGDDKARAKALVFLVNKIDGKNK
jgi:hypothetical protein